MFAEPPRGLPHDLPESLGEVKLVGEAGELRDFLDRQLAFSQQSAGLFDATQHLEPRRSQTCDDYLFQSWTNESREHLEYRRGTIISGGSTTGWVEYNVSGNNGGLGQFVVCTFTANATTQVFTYTSPEYAQINAFQVRDITAIPEPSSFAMVLGGIANLLLIRRRRVA